MSDYLMVRTLERTHHCLGESQDCLDKLVLSIADTNQQIRFSQQVVQAAWESLHKMPRLENHEEKQAAMP